MKTVLACFTSLCALATWASAAEPSLEAKRILEATGVRGGLIVHLGCGDGKLTAALRATDGYLVHGLDTDAANVEQARAHVRSRGLYGPVSVERWADAAHLPYIENLVNLLVGEDLGELSVAEVMRVLAPSGVAYIRSGGQWTKTVKPRPRQIDEWTHYLHDPSNNAVAHDAVVAPPRHLQWVGSPAWTRHHDHMTSFNAMVSAGGRVFYIVDEGLRAEIQLPPKWALVARDAFNGTILWKRSIDPWQTHLWPAKSGPAQLPRRLVAVGDAVYVTLGLDAPVTALDAATGKTIRTYEQTKATEEILCRDGILFALVQENSEVRPWSTRPRYAGFDEFHAEPETWAWDGSPRAIVAIEAGTGKVRWKSQSAVVPLTLAVDDAHLFFHDGTKVICLDRSTGRQSWASQPIARAAEIRSWFAPTLVAYQDVVLFAGAEKMVRHQGGKDTMTALSAANGELLWTAEHPPSGYDSPEDLLVVDGLVWTAPTTSRRDTGEFTGRDLHTGEIKRTFPCDCGDHMPHHRCHRAKATDRFILASRTGIEYVDLGAQHWNRNDWVRGACLYGILPANGLTYAPPQSCACYILAKLNGLNALAPARDEGTSASSVEPRGTRDESTQPPPLEHGPAYEEAQRHIGTKAQSEDEWSTYRHDAARSGSVKTSVPANLKRSWQAELGGKLSSPVVAEGKLFVAAVDRHTVYALDTGDGKTLWSYAAGGRVDSPPTIWQGRVLFGSADGYVYCLRASDGALVWRFRAAPAVQRLVAFEQLESVWPVHGSVLVHEAVVHCVAGRSMFLDGGMRYLRLDAITGKLLSQTILDNCNPETGKPLDADVKWPNLPVALPDILSYDGHYVYMRSQRFDLLGQRSEVVAPSDYKDQTGAGAHLFCPTGFLDDSWWHRTYWLFGKSALGGAGGWYTAAFRAPTGRIMVCDEKRVYSFDRQPQYYPRSTAVAYHLFAASKEPKILGGDSAGKPPLKPNRPAPSHPEYDWSYQAPLLGRALVLAGGTVFVAGPPRVVDEELTLSRFDDPETLRSLTEQSEAYEGKRGGLLLAVSTAGKKLAAYRLDSIPTFDGMAAAKGCLYLSTTDGKVVCLGGQGKPLPAAADVDLKAPQLAVRAGTGVTPTASHPDFPQLSQVRIAPADLGWRLQVVPGQAGFALKRLATPLTRQATFKFRMHMIPKDASADPPRNGYLAFGELPEEQYLVKCGLRRANGSIVEGPLLKGKVVSKPIASKVNETAEVVVTVDLSTQQVRMTVHDQTVETTLDRHLGAIQFVGYCANSVATDFSPVEIRGE